MPKLAKRQVFCCSGYILARFCPGEAINSPDSVREDHQKAQNSTTVTRIVALARKSLVFFVVLSNLKAFPKGQTE